ncbi:hypothetical protein B0T26DRAFT_504478 [Lasiosphaeria miniovina]|uniref:Uncharacterized protein n=1 Tax=Lasiosphaeria miniovina TaxID=1954250 RepID=A0AA40DJE2_9PEZI|nr:uncharacterized protein B0T26DRAFT_504478 [Lasiosphaeria miniovina]KAK0703551.1 hypothetical protein B0T26DRAFT_504478 [Lasiosphaeria miniovina]
MWGCLCWEQAGMTGCAGWEEGHTFPSYPYWVKTITTRKGIAGVWLFFFLNAPHFSYAYARFSPREIGRLGRQARSRARILATSLPSHSLSLYIIFIYLYWE